MLLELKTRTRPLQLALLITTFCGLLEGLFLAQLGEAVLSQFALALPVFLMYDALGYGFGATTAAQVCLRGNTDIGQFLRLHLVVLVLIGLGCSVFLLSIALLLYLHQNPMAGYLAVLSGLFPFYFANHGLWAFMRANNHTRQQARAMLTNSVLIVLLTALWVVVSDAQEQVNLEGHGAMLLLAAAGTTLYSVKLTASAVRKHPIRPARVFGPPGSLLSAVKFTLQQGGTISLSNLAIPAGVLLINFLLSTHARESLPAYALALRLEAFYLVPFFAFSAMVGPVLIKQKHQSTAAGVAPCLLHCLKIAIPIALVSATVPVLLQTALHQCPNTLPGLTTYFYIVPLSYGCYGIVMVVLASFNALLKPHLSLLVCGIRLLAFLAPLSLLLGQLYSVTGIFFAIALSHILSAFVAYYLLRVQSRNISNHPLTA